MHGHHLIIENEDKLKDIIYGGIFLEIGSCREAGSTKLLAELAKRHDMTFITVDPDQGAYERSTGILNKIDSNYKAVKELGEKYIEEYEGKIAIAYIDAFDNILEHWAHKPSTIKTYQDRNIEITNENSWKMHLEAAKGLKDKMVKGGYICFDDTVMKSGEWYGKGKFAVPYLLENGFDIIDNDYDNCLILKEGI